MRAGRWGAVAYLQHVRPARPHDPDPPLRSRECVVPLGRPVGPAFKVGERLEHQDLELVLGAESLDFGGRGAEGVVVGRLDVVVEVGAGEGEQVGHGQFDGLEAGGGYGGQFGGERVGRLADGAGRIAEGHGLEGLRVDGHCV